MKKVTVLLACTLIVVACNSREESSSSFTADDHSLVYDTSGSRKTVKEQPTRRAIGNFLYMDKGKCLHTDLNCIAMYQNEDNNTEELVGSSYALTRIPKGELTKQELTYCCRWCVDDSTYIELSAFTRE